MQNTLETALAGDYLDDVTTAIQQMRSNLAGMISPGLAAQAMRGFLRQYCKSVIGRTNLESDAEMLQELYKYFVDNSRYVQSRNFTFGTPTAGTNTGNGQILRLTRDKYNFPLEGGYVDSKRAICIADKNTGTGRGQEVFQLKGQASARDQLERSGSGLEGRLTGITIDDSILNNAGFRARSGTDASPTAITNWISTAGDSSSIYTFTTTTTFRQAPSDATDGSTVKAITLAASTRLQQKLSAARVNSLSPDIPYIMAVIWNRNSASGTFTFRMGNIGTTVTVSGQSGWTVTTVPNPMGQASWYRLFAQADLTFEIEWVRTSGSPVIAEVLVAPGTFFDGTWYWAIPNSTATYAQWRVLDSYTWADIATATTAKNQTWMHRTFPGFYLPSSNGSSIGWSEA